MNRIKELRYAVKLRQVDVGKATGIDQKTLSNYETGKTHPDSYALIRLADFFNVSIDYLVGRSDRNIIAGADKNLVCQRINEIQQQLEDLKRML